MNYYYDSAYNKYRMKEARHHKKTEGDCCYNCVFCKQRRNGGMKEWVCQNPESDSYALEIMNDECCELYEEKE